MSFKKYIKNKVKDLFKSKPKKETNNKLKPRNSEQKRILDNRKNKTDTQIVKKNNTNVKKKSTEIKKDRVNINKNKKKSTTLRDLAIGTGIAATGTAANKYFSDDASSSTKKKFGNPGTGNEIKGKKKFGNPGTGNEVKAKKNYGMGMVDSLSKAKVKQGPPKPPAKKKKPGFLDRVKSDFNKAVLETKRNFQGDAKKKTGRYKSVNERNLDSKGNYKGTNIKPTKLQESRMKKPKKNTMDFGAKKKKASAPMYESKGTMGGVKKSKYYSGGGTVFTGR